MKTRAIRIVKENAAAIENLLQQTNGKAQMHYYTTFYEIEKIAIQAEIRVGELLLRKKDFPGAVLKMTSGKPVPKRYDYKRIATTIVITRKRDGWYLSSADKSYVGVSGGRNRLFLTDAQDARSHNDLSTKYSVLPPVA